MVHQDPRRYAPQQMELTFQTDHGAITASAFIQAFPRHHLQLDYSVNHALIDDEPWSFNLTHREVFEKGSNAAPTELKWPKEFEIVRLGEQTQPVSGTTDLLYRDTDYRLTLIDREMGTHKASIVLKDQKGGIIIDSPILWHRVPYLSAVPEKVIIGEKPVRVFLRCPDETIEITRVVSAPAGIRALVSSPREISVLLEKEAPAVIDGVIVAETSDEARGKLKIPVRRYSSALLHSDASSNRSTRELVGQRVGGAEHAR